MTVQYFLPSQARLDGVMIGTLLALPDDGSPRVSFPVAPTHRALSPAAWRH